MEPIFLFDLASRKSAWLAARQSAIAGNIANANTPGYKAKDLASFTDVYDRTKLDLAITNSRDIGVSGGTEATASATKDDSAGFEVTESGNTVGVEDELIKAGDVNREYAMTTNIMKTFHSMLMASLKE